MQVCCYRRADGRAGVAKGGSGAPGGPARCFRAARAGHRDSAGDSDSLPGGCSEWVAEVGPVAEVGNAVPYSAMASAAAREPAAHTGATGGLAATQPAVARHYSVAESVARVARPRGWAYDVPAGRRE